MEVSTSRERYGWDIAVSSATSSNHRIASTKSLCKQSHNNFEIRTILVPCPVCGRTRILSVRTDRSCTLVIQQHTLQIFPRSFASHVLHPDNKFNNEFLEFQVSFLGYTATLVQILISHFKIPSISYHDMKWKNETEEHHRNSVTF